MVVQRPFDERERGCIIEVASEKQEEHRGEESVLPWQREVGSGVPCRVRIDWSVRKMANRWRFIL